MSTLSNTIDSLTKQNGSSGSKRYIVDGDECIETGRYARRTTSVIGSLDPVIEQLTEVEFASGTIRWITPGECFEIYTKSSSEEN